MRLLKQVMSDKLVGFEFCLVCGAGKDVVLDFLTKLDSTVTPFILHVAEFELLVSAGQAEH